LPLGGGRSARLRAARSDETAAEAGVALAALEMRRDLTVAYAEAVAADRLAGIARERAALGAGTRDAVAKRHAAGLESDLQRARVEVETAAMQAEARRAAAAALAHRRALAAHWREETVTAPLDESWFDAAPRPVGPVDASVADAVSVDAHPLLRVARARIEQAKALLESARGARYGGLEATAGTRRYKDSPDGDRAWVLGLAMPLPLWDRNEAGIAEARAALQAAELDAERATRDIASGRESARADLDAARLEVEALEASGVPSAAAAAQLSAQGYEAGRLSLLERLDAERAWVQAREQLVSARLRLRAAEARLAAYQASSTER
jgi:cobalt-zinc-cadmium efflux system outer membrane protein